MYDIRFTPKIRTTIAMPFSQNEREAARTPSPQKEHAEGGAIVWRTLEYVHREKDGNWFLAVGIVAAALAVAGAILGNVLFSGLVVIATIAVFLHAIRPPAHIRCEIGKNGILLEKTRYHYKDIERFWVREEGETPVLRLQTTHALSPYLHIPMRREDVSRVRGFLGRFVPEDEFPEPLAHQLAEAFGL